MLKKEDFYAIDDRTLYFATRDLQTGDILYAEIVWVYPTERDLYLDLYVKGLPREPVYY